MKTILLTGGTGFVGSVFIKKYHRKYKIIAIYRGSRPSSTQVEWFPLDLTSTADFAAAAHRLRRRHIFAIVHLGGSSPNRAYRDGHYRATFDGTINLIQLATRLNISRLIYVSSLSARVDYNGPYKLSKLTAEAFIRQSSLDYTTIRPTNILGPTAPEFLRFLRFLRSSPIVPLVDSGLTRTQPIFVGDVVKIISHCLNDSKTISHEYDLVGPDCLTQSEFVNLCLHRLKTSSVVIPVPRPLLTSLASIVARINPRLGLNPERVHLQSQDVCLDHHFLEKTFGFRLTSLSRILTLSLKSLSG